MNTKHIISSCFLSAILCASCSSGYHLSNITRDRILIDNKYDASPDADANKFMEPFKHRVDSIMAPIVGTTSAPLASYRPESPLSNLLSDILVWGAKPYQQQVDFAVYNIGGIRAAFAKGDITVGDVVDVAPFENKICFLTLSGEKVMELFKQIASTGGEGVSGSVHLEITKQGELKKALINNQPIDPNKQYRIATLDYLAQGNDKLEAFKSKTNVLSPQDYHSNVRFIIMDYFREAAKQGQKVGAKVEGRITILP